MENHLKKFFLDKKQITALRRQSVQPTELRARFKDN